MTVTRSANAITFATTITQYTDALARAAISLTTTGNSGASTYNNSTGVFNIPNYTLAGLGGQPISEKGQANGYTPLDANGKVPLIYINDVILGQVRYIGTWNAATNTPTLPDPTTVKGNYYVATSDGTQFGKDFRTGDWVISDGVIWDKVDNTDAVATVFGRIGNILAVESDYEAFYPRLSQSYANPSWIASLAWSKITGTPTTLSGYGITDAVPSSRSITINGTTFDLSANRTWNVGTVTSVALSLPNIFNLTGSPITGAGTFTVSLANQSAFHVFARGAGAGVPSFINLVEDHLPNNISLGKLQNITGPTVLGRDTGSGQIQQLTGSQVLTIAGAVPTSRNINTNNGLTGGGNLTADRTLGLTGQALALHNLASNGFIVRTGAGTVAGRQLVEGTGIAISSPDGVSGNPTISFNTTFGDGRYALVGGSNATGVWPIALNVFDTRNVVTGPQVGTGRGVRFDFLMNSTDGLSDGGTFHGVMTFQQWGDSSGGGTRQLGFTDNNNLWIRGSGSGLSSYGAWKRIWDSESLRSDAQNDARYSQIGHVHSAADITSGVLSYDRLPITSTQVTNWDTAFGWGNHALAGYEPSFSKGSVVQGSGLTLSGTLTSRLVGTGDITFGVNFGTTAGTVAEGNDSRINNGQTAFGWGNHASAGYALSNGSNATGTWGINITGNASSANSLNSENFISRRGSSGNYNTDFQNTPAGTFRFIGDDSSIANNPGGEWWFVENYRHSNGTNFWGTQVAWGWEDNANRLATRNVQPGTFGPWVYYLNSSNFNSYSPTLTGTGASGTWGINITGDANTVNGFSAATFFRNLGFEGGGSDANTIAESRSAFTYAQNAPWNGPIAYIGASGYGLQLNANYWDGNGISFRVRNGDVATWNQWRQIWHTGNLSSPIQGSGTLNFIPKFTGANTLGNSLIFDNGTNVLIGTTSELTGGGRLQVNGDVNSTRFTNLGTRGNANAIINARNHFVQFNAGNVTLDGGWIAAAFGDATNNRVVIGQGNVGNGAIIGGHTANLDAWADLTTVAVNHRFLNDSFTEVMRITSDGNVLMGTATGLSGGGRLQVSGTGGINVLTGANENDFGLKFRNSLATSYSGVGFFNNSDQVSGYLLLRNGVSTNVYTAGGITLVSDTGDLNLAARGASRIIRFYTNGATQRGTLDGSGNLAVTGDIIAFSSSDARLKNNLTRITDPIEKILKLGGYSFRWNDKQDAYTGMDYGVIAQEVEAIFPELVTTRDTGYKAVKYEKLIPVLIEAIKELNNKIEYLEGK